MFLGQLALSVGGCLDPNLAAERLQSPDAAALWVPEKAEVHFVCELHNAAGRCEVGFFFVDGPDGRITRRRGGSPEGVPLLSAAGKPQYVYPGDSDYAEVALAAGNCQTLFDSPAEGASPAERVVEIKADRFLACYVIQDASSDQWRRAAAWKKAPVWISFEEANREAASHLRSVPPRASGRRGALREYWLEDVKAAHGVSGNTTNFSGVLLSVRVAPIAIFDDYSIFCEGEDFNGKPLPLRLTGSEGLLYNDYAPGGGPLRVTEVTLNETDWLPVPEGGRSWDAPADICQLHGRLTVWPSGAVEFLPNDDGYWKPSAVGEGAFFHYRLSDGIASDEAIVRLARGFGHWGQAADETHDGRRMYFLAGGYPDDIADGQKEFFVRGSRLHDVVLISQGGDQAELRDKVVGLTGGRVRSVTSLSITARDQAEDPRVVRIVAGADAIWLGGGDQRIYHNLWQGVGKGAGARSRLFAALQDAARGSTAVGGISAGMAVLGQAMYLNEPWDSVDSSFAVEAPGHPRLRLISQLDSALPFANLSQSATAPLHNLIMDPHFAERHRMGRLAAFVARAKLDGVLPRLPYGLGVDGDATVLIEEQGGAWNWTVYGAGFAYLISSSAIPSYDQRGRLELGPINVFCLEPGRTYRYPQFTQAAPYEVVQVSGGTCYTTEHNGEMYRRAGQGRAEAGTRAKHKSSVLSPGGIR